MNVGFYTAATGANQQQKRLDIHANNIANVNTYGFKAERSTFSALMYGNLAGIDGAELPRGTGARMIMAETDFADGTPAQTGRPHDYAISGEGFFGLIEPRSGEISYTRKGAFSPSSFQRMNPEGVEETVYLLSDNLGRFVLGQDGQPVEIPENDDGAALPIAVYGFDHTNGMRALGGGRFAPVDKNGAPRMLNNASVNQGFVESSNADLATELTKVIEAQRTYSYALRMVTTAEEVESTINGLRG